MTVVFEQREQTGTCDRCSRLQVERYHYEYEVCVQDGRTLVMFDRLCKDCLEIANKGIDTGSEGVLDLPK